MQINVSFDQATSSLPTGFVTAVNYVVNYFDSLFTNPVTIDINVGYGEVDGTPLGSGALGESLTFLNSVSYSTLRNALANDATSPSDATAVASLPVSDPITGTHTYWVSTAEQKALGLLTPNSTAIDGYVGFSSTASFDYNQSDGISPGFYDFIGTVEHEISEVMGRVALAGDTVGRFANSFEPLDLFDYSSAGVRRLVGSTPGYFSINGGVTNLNNFNTNPGGDFGDWASSAGPDAGLAFSGTGVVMPFSKADLTAMDVIGWNLVSTPPLAPTIASFSPDTGVVGDGITSAKVLTLAGTAPASSTVNLYDGSTLLGTATAGSSGAWSFTTATLNDGTHSFTATDTVSGSTSSASAALNVTVDTTAPIAPIASINGVINTNQVVLAGTAEANSTVRIFDGATQIGSVTANGSGTWNFTTGALSNATHSLTATATDAAANTSLASSALVVTVGAVVSSGNVLMVAGGDVAIGTVVSGGTEQVFGSASGTVVSGGGTEVVYSGGTDQGATVIGTQLIWTGGVANGAHVNSGGLQQDLGSVSGTVVSSGGTEIVYSGGTDQGATVNGTQQILSGGIANGAHVGSGGLQQVVGSVSGTVVSSGGTEVVYSGGTDQGATVNGTQLIWTGGVANGAHVNSGGLQQIVGSASGTVVSSGGLEIVYSGGTDQGATVNGTQQIWSGGIADAAHINSGGLQQVLGSASGTVVSSGGTEVVYSGGTDQGATVNGTQLIWTGGVANGAHVNSGGSQQIVGSASGTVVSSGGLEVIVSGGAASGSIVGIGGTEVVSGSGTDSGATINGGTQYDYGTANGAGVLSGGFQIVAAGASASGTTVSSGGEQYVLGSASATQVNSGGLDYVASGGVATGATISGGTLEIASGGSTGSAAVTFTLSAGGTLQLDASISFGGFVAGFGKPDALDLRDISYISGTTSQTFVEAGSNLSGTLTVTDGTHIANLTLLGQYATGNFTLASDGHGGTLVTDPPITVATDQHSFLSQPRYG